MDGENNGSKPYFLMDDLGTFGGTIIFGNTHFLESTMTQHKHAVYHLSKQIRKYYPSVWSQISDSHQK